MYRKSVILLVSVFLVIIAGCGVKVEVSGVVSSTIDEAAIQGASITATPIDKEQNRAEEVTETTKEEGRYRLALFPYRYNIKVVHKDYKELELKDQFLAGDKNNLDIKLEPLTEMVIVVYDKEINDFVTHVAEIRIINKDTQKQVDGGKLNEKNRYIVRVPPGTYTIQASYKERPKKKDVGLTGVGKSQIELVELETPKRWLVISILNGKENVTDKATINIINNDTQKLVTDGDLKENKKYSVEVPLGKYTIKVSYNGKSAEQYVDLKEIDTNPKEEEINLNQPGPTTSPPGESGSGSVEQRKGNPQ